ncbi:hypothetical protein AAC387_Pa11g0549 [Persea americana]
MDKTWTTLDSQDRMAIRMCREYRDRVKSFIEFAKANVGDATEIWCHVGFANIITNHLPREAMLAGPMQYRWMYPFERFLGT